MKVHISLLERIWTFFLALIMVSQCIGGTPIPSVLYSVALAMSVIVFTDKGKMGFDKTILVLVFVCLVSILIGNPDPRFKSITRLLYFVVLLWVVSPLFHSNRLSELRHILLYDVFHLITILCVGSFFCYFLGINLMRDLEYLSVGGHFGGLTRHSMLLGPLSAVSCLYILSSKEVFFVKKWRRISCFIFCLGSLFFAASRGAVLGGLVALVSFLFMKSQNKVKFVKIILGISIVLLVTFPLWNFALDGIRYKTEVRDVAVEVGSRDSRFENRWREFMSNPLTGVGFCAARSFSLPEVTSSGTVEYGTSWLCVLATTGAVGFLTLLIVLYKRFKCVFLLRYDIDKALLLVSLLIFFFIHFLIEGYIFSAGNPLCFIFWLIVGNTYLGDNYLKYANIITNKRNR